MTGSLQIKAKKWYVVVRLLDGDGKGKYKWVPTGIDAGSIPDAENICRRRRQRRLMFSHSGITIRARPKTSATPRNGKMKLSLA